MYHSILVPLDGSALAEHALATAKALASRFGASLHVVHVHHPGVVSELATYGLTAVAARESAENYVAGVANRVAAAQDGRVTGTVLDGSAAPSILAHAHQVTANLIVMSSHGRTGASRFWLGSVTDAVVRSATVPVLMLRNVAASLMAERVIVPLDGSSTAELALPHAIALANPNDASVHLLQVEESAEDLRASVWGLAAHEPDDLPNRLRRADKYLHDTVARFRNQWPPLTVSVEARGGHRIGEAIAQVAVERGADLVAMSTHGRGATRLLVGSVADKVVRGTECSILLVRGA